jgi:hypothetical protein
MSPVSIRHQLTAKTLSPERHIDAKTARIVCSRQFEVSIANLSGSD